MSDIRQLRESIFATIQGLKDGTIDLEKAKVIGELSQVMINSAKVEVEYIRANGGGAAAFFPDNDSVPLLSSPTQTGMKMVKGNLTVHKLKG
ncbi:hypothetical protein ACW4YW_15135 [Methylobacillus pratensis]